jgi:CRISPR type I-F-associated protein Csy2
VIFLKCPTITVAGAHALNGMYACGFPAMTAINGYVHYLAKQISVFLDMDVTLKAFSVVHHSSSLHAYGDKYHSKLTQRAYLHDRHGPPNGASGWFNTSQKPMPEMDLTVSLILIIDVDLDPETMTNELKTLEWALVLGARAFGGAIQSASSPSAHASYGSALHRLPAGDVMVGKSATLVEEGTDALTVLCRELSVAQHHNRIFFDNRRSGKHALNEGKSEILLAPMHVGWRAISAISKKAGADRPDLDHAFVEPIMTLVEFEPKFKVHERVKDADFGDLDLPGIWQPVIDRPSGVFYLIDRSEKA